MAKVGGFPFTVAVDDHLGAAKTISNDILSITFSTPRGQMDATGVDKSGMERLLLLADGTVTFNGIFNSATDFSHDVFSTVSSTSVVRTVTLTVDSQVLAMEMLFADYVVTRAADGSLTWTVTGQNANGAVPTWA